MVNRLKRRLAQWLPPGYARRRMMQMMICDAAALIHPEGCIENLSLDRSRITIGAHSQLRGRLLTYAHGGRISIGEWCYVGVRSEIWSMDSITIGDRVLIAHDVNIHDGSAHSLNPSERHMQFRSIVEAGHPRRQAELPGVSSSPIMIEDDVWISFGVTILKGVRICSGSVIAANSVVINDVPPGMLYRCEVFPIMTPIEVREDG